MLREEVLAVDGQAVLGMEPVQVVEPRAVTQADQLTHATFPQVVHQLVHLGVPDDDPGELGQQRVVVGQPGVRSGGRLEQCLQMWSHLESQEVTDCGQNKI